jgi:hypothetical protein
MAINQGLKTLVESTPNFSNQGVQNLIAPVNIGWVLKTRTLAQKVDASEILNVSQKNDLYDTLNTQPHLNLGRVLEDLDLHTAKIYTGELGEARDDNPASLFLDHVQTVQSFIATIPTLYGYSADSINKGVNGHFGTVNGVINSAVNALKDAVVHINSKSLGTDTAYQSATQDLIDFIDALGDSSAFDESTFNSLQSAFQTAADNFNTTLAGGAYTVYRTNMIAARKTIVDQIALEVANLGTIDTYNESLSTLATYASLAENADISDLIVKSSQNPNFRSYFENYADRAAKLNPLYSGVSDSSEEIQIQEILKLKGLPDVTDPLDLDSVAAKATRDDRLRTSVSFQGKNTEQIINTACDQLGIVKTGKNIYGLSKSLLANLNQHDRDVIKTELNINQQIDTLS